MISTAATTASSADTDHLELCVTRDSAGWLINLRWLAVGAVLIAVMVAAAGLAGLQPSSVPVLGIATVALALSNVAYQRAQANVTDLPRFVVTQISTDLVILTILLLASGGLSNPFYTLYTLHVLITSAMLTRKHAYAVAGAGTVAIAGLGIAEMTGLVDVRALGGDVTPVAILARVVVGAALLWGVAFVGASACQIVRERERLLAQATGQLRLANDELRRVANSTGDAMFLWADPDNVVWSNQRACADFGCGAAEGPLQGCGKICPHRAVILAALSEGSSQEEEKPVTENGHTRTLRTRAIPLRSGGTQVDRVLLLVHDLTSERAMEQQLLQATKMGVLARVTGAMAHEIGNPLAALAARADLLNHRDDPGFVKESADVLKTQIERIQRLVKSVQRFGRPTGGEGADADVEQVTGDILKIVRLDPRARGITITADVPSDLPRVPVGRDPLTQVYLNLALNALDAMAGEGQLALGARRDGETVELTFTDDGPGLPREMRENLFCPFHSTKPEGTGLGLFFSRRVVTEAGGEIRAEDVPGGGTRFVVRLPAVKADETVEDPWAVPS